MKRIFLFGLMIAVSFLLSCGQDLQADQAGVPSAMSIPQHGHNSAIDGGPVNLPTFRATLSIDQLKTCNTSWDLIHFDTETWDNMDWFEAVTNHTYTPQQEGKYLCNLCVTATATTPNTFGLKILKNNLDYSQVTIPTNLGSGIGHCLTDLVALNGSTDYVSAKVKLNGAAACTVTTTNTSFNCTKIAN